LIWASRESEQLNGGGEIKNQRVGLLGDTSQRSYGEKLDLFNRFAAPELRRLIAGLELQADDIVLDAGCGAGLITTWLAEQTPAGRVIGLDLSAAHLQLARQHLSQNSLPLTFVQGDMQELPYQTGLFDLIWSSNAINHLRQPVAGIRTLAQKLRPGGRLVLGQSVFLPEMFFAWDARLEKEVMLACRHYYRDKYNLAERDTTHIRNLFGWLKQAGLQNVTTRTTCIERTAPLTPEDEHYFVVGVFNGYWGHRVQPYLSAEDWKTLSDLCDPASPHFCLRRPDFHHLQTFTVVIGETPASQAG
jgi:SAM-dependent methyltransferase